MPKNKKPNDENKSFGRSNPHDSQNSENIANCSFCSNGRMHDCPYWYTDSDGFAWHDSSGAQGYIDSEILNDRYELHGKDGWEKLPNTDNPDKKPEKFSIWKKLF